jgi:hypothetical protein
MEAKLTHYRLGLRKCDTPAMKNDILLFSSKWMELENIILSEVSQVQKTRNCMFSLICGLQI